MWGVWITVKYSDGSVKAYWASQNDYQYLTYATEAEAKKVANIWNATENRKVVYEARQIW